MSEQRDLTEPVLELDCRGLSCPEPLMKLRFALKHAESGSLVRFLSDDPVSLRDVPAFCDFVGHHLLALPDDAHPARYLIRKK
ncbi:MAG: sulfurtransferase TusA family protein [Succinivibrionaceae bacterium]|nr:sulfurtransferase TusA family protein [Succinivibrionaceae bacterium]